jgi:hypothetical protein
MNIHIHAHIYQVAGRLVWIHGLLQRLRIPLKVI